MQLSANTELQNGKYRIIRVLGQGGFGITYLAENTFFDRLVAVKEFFPKDFCGRDDSSCLTLCTQNNVETVAKLKERFLKEAKNIAKLDHPSIVKIHDIFEENNTAYYVMDYIEGENLNEMVKRNGPLSETRAVEYIRKVGDALEYIHSRKMTHFDVKPANIMVHREDNCPILIDFGLSKQYDTHGDATSTLLSGVSNGYSPIELYGSNGIISFSPQSDVYSLGATMYFLLTNNVPPTATALISGDDYLNIPYNISSAVADGLKSALEVIKVRRCSDVKSFLDKIRGAESNQAQKVQQTGIDTDSTLLITPQIEDSEKNNNLKQKKPVIKAFRRKGKTPIYKGDSFVLEWDVVGADVITIDGKRIPGSERTKSFIARTKDSDARKFTLVARNQAGIVSKDISVAILPQRVNESQTGDLKLKKPIIKSFKRKGGTPLYRGNKFILEWNVEGADVITIDGKRMPNTVGTQCFVARTRDYEARKFTLVARNQAGIVSKDISVAIYKMCEPSVRYFRIVQEGVFYVGDHLTLEWCVDYADEVRINGMSFSSRGEHVIELSKVGNNRFELIASNRDSQDVRKSLVIYGNRQRKPGLFVRVFSSMFSFLK